MSMYNQYSGYGYPTQNIIKHVPKYQVYSMISMYVSQLYKVQVKQLIKLEEIPDALRHSCLYTGVVLLPKQFFSLQNGMEVIQIPFYFCSVCGNLYVYQNFYE